MTTKFYSRFKVMAVKKKVTSIEEYLQNVCFYRCDLVCNREMATRQQMDLHACKTYEEERAGLTLCSQPFTTYPTYTHTLRRFLCCVIMSSNELNSTDLGRALCIITGASRGLGRTIAREMARLVKPGSVLVLAARSADDLRALQAELAESEAGRAGVVVDCVVVDLGQAEGPESVVKASKEVFSEEMDHIILVNNAGK